MRDDEIMEIEDVAPAEEPPTAKKGKKKSISSRVWRNLIVRNVIYAVTGFAVLIVIIHFALLLGTQHGRSFPVPDFTGMTIDEAVAVAQSNHLRLEVVDSVFVSQRQRGTIFRQTPEPDVHVKKNRRILITINALSPRKVTVPDVVGYSLRQAKAVLTSQGLTVGKLRYEPDIATNNVLAQRYKGTVVAKNTQLIAGSEIDLELGLSSSEQRTVIPFTMGLSAEAAKELLLDNSLNATFHYNKSIRTYADSLAARAYRQTPSPSVTAIWPLGTKVEVYFMLEESTDDKTEE